MTEVNGHHDDTLDRLWNNSLLLQKGAPNTDGSLPLMEHQTPSFSDSLGPPEQPLEEEEERWEETGKEFGR